MKGILLSGGTGSRLYPLTITNNKQLLPVYDKPMVYYPMSTLISCGIYDICIISDKKYIEYYKELFKNSYKLGLKITYLVQENPNGIAEAFIIAKEWINNDPVCLILGDNIFHGYPKIKHHDSGAIIFAYKVNNPSEYGVVEFNLNEKVISIEEKPKLPKSNYAIPGLYFFDKNVTKYASELIKSERGELEITDLIKRYLTNDELWVAKFNYGAVWLDAGNADMLFQSAAYIKTIQDRQGIMVGCIEEECYKKKLICKKDLYDIIDHLPNSEYKNYLLKIYK